MKTQYISKPEDFYKIAYNDKVDSFDFEIINADVIEISYNFREETSSDPVNSNVDIAAFTTSHARLRLYEGLKKLGRQVLYYDTDICI